MISQVAPGGEINWIITGGATSVLLWVIIALIKGWLHTDKEFRRETEDKLFYREMALRGVGAAEQIGQITRQLTTTDLDQAVKRALEERGDR